MNVNTVDLIFSTLTNSKICEGNCDFIDLIKYKINLSQPEHFESSSADDVGLIQTFHFDTWDDLSVIQHHNCSWLVQDGVIERCYTTLLGSSFTACRSNASNSEPIYN